MQQAMHKSACRAPAHVLAPCPLCAQVYSTSRDGTLRLWDLATLKCLRIWAVRENVRHMVVHATLRLAYMSIEWGSNETGRIISWDLVKGKAGNNAMKTRVVGPLAMHPQGG